MSPLFTTLNQNSVVFGSVITLALFWSNDYHTHQTLLCSSGRNASLLGLIHSITCPQFIPCLLLLSHMNRCCLYWSFGLGFLVPLYASPVLQILLQSLVFMRLLLSHSTTEQGYHHQFLWSLRSLKPSHFPITAFLFSSSIFWPILCWRFWFVVWAP